MSSASIIACITFCFCLVVIITINEFYLDSVHQGRTQNVSRFFSLIFSVRESYGIFCDYGYFGFANPWILFFFSLSWISRDQIQSSEIECLFRCKYHIENPEHFLNINIVILQANNTTYTLIKLSIHKCTKTCTFISSV